jgi:hypothetical protein
LSLPRFRESAPSARSHPSFRFRSVLIRLCVALCTSATLGCAGLLSGQPPSAESLEESAKSQAEEAAQQKADEAKADALDATGVSDLKAKADATASRAKALGATPAQVQEYRVAEDARTAHMATLPSGSRWSKARKQAEEQSTAEPLILGLWRQGMIRCGKGRCEDLYWLHVPTEMRVVVEANGPIESGQPDFGLSLLDGKLELLNLNRAARRRPRTIDEHLTEGIHYVKVFSLEKSSQQLSYQVRARRFDASDAAAPPAPETPIAEPRPQATPEASENVPAPTPRTVRLESELLEVERSGGAAVAVLIEAGIAEGIRQGMRGELVERGRVIGRIEVVKAYSAGSRAKIVGGLSGKLTQDARAVFQLPAR